MNQNTFYILSIAITVIGFVFSIGSNYQSMKDLKTAFEEHKEEDRRLTNRVSNIESEMSYAKGFNANTNKNS